MQKSTDTSRDELLKDFHEMEFKNVKEKMNNYITKIKNLYLAEEHPVLKRKFILALIMKDNLYSLGTNTSNPVVSEELSYGVGLLFNEFRDLFSEIQKETNVKKDYYGEFLIKQLVQDYLDLSEKEIRKIIKYIVGEESELNQEEKDRFFSALLDIGMFKENIDSNIYVETINIIYEMDPKNKYLEEINKYIRYIIKNHEGDWYNNLSIKYLNIFGGYDQKDNWISGNESAYEATGMLSDSEIALYYLRSVPGVKLAEEADMSLNFKTSYLLYLASSVNPTNYKHIMTYKKKDLGFTKRQFDSYIHSIANSMMTTDVDKYREVLKDKSN